MPKRHSKKPTRQQKVAVTRKRTQALVKAYFEKFGPIGSFALTKENLNAIKSALASDVDHVDLVRQREERET